MEESELTWVERAKAGDQASFTRLVEAYQTPAYNLAYRMLGSAAEAEDAAQEAFVRAYTRLSTYDAERKFSSWLLAIVSHYCVDMLRRRRITQVSLDDMPPMGELSMPVATQPEQIVIRRQESRTVQELLNALPPSYRTPVILRYWYDMSYEEIAETMNVTESTVKTRLHRARAMMAHSLPSAS